MIKKTIYSLLALVLLAVFLPSCNKVNTTPVGVTVTPPFTWHATGDDGIIGQAAAYEFRMSTDSAALVNNFSAQTLITGAPAPKVSGSLETWAPTINVELGVKYYFAVVVIDDAGNRSQVSNVTHRTFPDNVPPSPVLDLQ
jgi:hypothetical protein